MKTRQADVSKVGSIQGINPGSYPAYVLGLNVHERSFKRGNTNTTAIVFEPVVLIAPQAEKATNPQVKTDDRGFVLREEDSKKHIFATDENGQVIEVNGAGIVGYTMYAKGMFCTLDPFREPREEWKSYLNFLDICGIPYDEEEIAKGILPELEKDDPLVIGAPVVAYLDQDVYTTTEVNKETNETKTVTKKKARVYDFFPWGNGQALSAEALELLSEQLKAAQEAKESASSNGEATPAESAAADGFSF